MKFHSAIFTSAAAICVASCLAFSAFAQGLPKASKPEDVGFSSERLKRIARNVGPIQLIYGGKAHPRDDGGKRIIRQVFEGAQSASDVIRTVYVENYDMYWGKLITSGVDVWLNNPLRPQEASGTSGMKAAMNGVPSFSVVDGWWAEGLIEGITGWAIGNTEINEDPVSELATLYDKLEREILPMFYGRPQRYTEVMRSAIALNGSFFNTQRMVEQYVRNAYFPDDTQVLETVGD